MHMLHVTIGVIYLGCGGAAEVVSATFGVLWLAGVFLIPADNVFHYGIHALLIGLIVASVILFLKPKDYDHMMWKSRDCTGILWICMDVYFPLVYLMSTKV